MTTGDTGGKQAQHRNHKEETLHDMLLARRAMAGLERASARI
jgi:hypothetical protein